MNADLQGLLDKIKALSPRRRAEVEDFVDFLKARERAEAAERLGQAFDKLDALDGPPLASSEVQAEIRAARALCVQPAMRADAISLLRPSR